MTLQEKLYDLNDRYEQLNADREELEKVFEPVLNHWVNFMLSFRAEYQKKHGHYSHPPTAVIPADYFPPYGAYGYELSQDQAPGFLTYEGEDRDNQSFVLTIPMAFVDDPEVFKNVATGEWNSAIETYLRDQTQRKQQSEKDSKRAQYLKLKAEFEPEEVNK